MPRIHTIEVERLTPLGRLIFDYMRRRWLPTKTAFAQHVDIRPNTVDSLLYSDHEPSARTLRKVIAKTGIPAAAVYAAISPVVPTLPADAIALPQARPLTPRQQEARMRPQVAQRTPSTALDDAIARIRATEHPAMAEVMVEALLARAGQQDARTYWQTRIDEEHNHDLISTMVHAAIPPHSTVDADNVAPEAQAESQPAGNRS